MAREPRGQQGELTMLMREAECPVCLQEMVCIMIMIMIMIVMIISGLQDLAVLQWSPGV